MRLIDYRVLRWDGAGFVEVALQRLPDAAPVSAEDRRDKTAVGDIALRRRDALGEPRNWHAHIGGDRLGAGTQAPPSPIGIVPGLP